MDRQMRLNRWFPEQSELTDCGIGLAAGGAFLGIGLVALISHWILDGSAAPFLIASLGASSVLLFVVPSSPMSKPWPFAGGHLVSAFIGVACYQLTPHILTAAPLAMALAILAMYYLRCLHPPGGAVALIAVLGGDSVHALGFHFVLAPVALNVAVMLAVAAVFWRLALHRTVGARTRLDQHWQRNEEAWLAEHPPFTEHDLAHALAEMGTFIDVTREDLYEIFARAQTHAHAQELGHIRASEIMSNPVIAVEFGSPLEEVWELLQRHNIRGMPVVDRGKNLLGMVTVSDFVRHAEHFDHPTLAERLAHLRRPTPSLESNKPEVAGQIMTAPVISVGVEVPVSEAVSVFSRHKIHHLPVVDEKGKVRGMLTREDVMTARARKPSGHEEEQQR
jgi:CBS domain-containing membrane protein